MQPAGCGEDPQRLQSAARRRIDPEKQFDKAIESFYRNGFMVLVNDQQVDELEEEIEVSPDTTVTFLKLVPLVGG